MQVKTLNKKLSLSQSPYEVYQRLSNNGQKSHTALLETAEAGTHNYQKSILMLSAAVKISAMNRKVIMQALNPNGEAFLKAFDTQHIPSKEISKGNSVISFCISKQELCVDEKQRLLQQSILTVLKEVTRQLQTDSVHDNATSFLIGAFSFDLVDQFEVVPQINKQDEDLCFYLADQLLIQSVDSQTASIVVKGFADYAENTIRLGLNLSHLNELLDAPVSELMVSHVANSIAVNTTDDEYAEMVASAKRHIIDGDVFQVVLSRTYAVDCANALDSYRVLRKNNPSPYMYFINFGDKQLFGASPESALKVDINQEISLYPIAGTRRRAVGNGSFDYEKDSKIELELIQDEKENAEHMMLVDLARNDLARIIKTGTRRISKLKQVVKYSHVMHLVSEVKGALKSEMDCFDAYRACANMGTLTGAPKIKACEIIRQLENKPRGLYGGAVALVNANLEFDSAIIIRSAVVKDDIAYISAGAGIVYDSNPELEAQETYNKAKAVIDACLSSNQNLTEVLEYSLSKESVA
ncbi:MAG: anthranilate synthase component 1 [Kangiellaceae bacterium]|nr:anthranilate synthase component 1 [Kangiellaceae bacterium]